MGIAFVIGVFFALQYYVPMRWPEKLLSNVANWEITVGIFAVGLGLVSLFHLHITKIKRKAPAWGFSVVMFIALFGMMAAGIYCANVSINKETNFPTIYGWLYLNLMVPLQSTMFAILAFYIASAAFRAFRAKTKEATLLLVAAIIVMFARVPMGEHIYAQIPHFKAFGLTMPVPIGNISEWILRVLNTASQGGILLGICLGGIAMAFKIIFGIERAYMGGGK